MAHDHIVTDSDKHFTIDPVSKEIKSKSDRIVLIQRSHKSERFTFDLPRYIEGHDMSLCNTVNIHYQNKELSSGTEYDDVYEVEDFGVVAYDESKVSCSWLISGNATQYVGSLNFSISFECVAEDGTVEYCWPTAEYIGVIVAKSMYNAETVAAAYSDILAKWKADLYLASVGQTVTPEEICEILGAVVAKTRSVTLPAANWVDGAMTVAVEGVTANSSKCHVFVTYAPESYQQYMDSSVRAAAQGEGTLSFACNSIVPPTADIIMNVAIYYGE